MSASWLPVDWFAAGNVVAGYSLRQGGVSQGPFASLNLGAHVGDDAVNVAENRRRLSDMCQLPSEPLWLHQVHGTRVASKDDCETAADAIVTRDSGVVCVVQTADCLPVLFAADDGSVVAAAHAGWRGLADGIIEETVDAMAIPGERVQAYLAPAISARAFEVGDEVRSRFVDADAGSAAEFEQNESGRWQADLYGLARRRLGSVGVKRISGGGRCTYLEREAFFSYRRDGECGRMASFIYRR